MKIPGIIHQADLRRRMERSEIRSLQRRGVIRHVGTWYVTAEAPGDVVALLAIGMRPACVDAASLLGLWVPPVGGVHAFRPRNAGARGRRAIGSGCAAGNDLVSSESAENAAESCESSGNVMASGESSGIVTRSGEGAGRAVPSGVPAGPVALLPIRRRSAGASRSLSRVPSGAPDRGSGPSETSLRPSRLVLHAPHLRVWPDREPVPPIDLVLQQVARCLSTEYAAIVVESAIERGAIGRADAMQIVDGMPPLPRRALQRIRDDAGSGTETRVRWWFESRRVEVRSQVWIEGVGRVDLLIGRCWVIECDSRAFHDLPDQYRTDRERDLRLRALGYLVTRLTWEQVFVTWAATQLALLAVLARGDHRRVPAHRLVTA